MAFQIAPTLIVFLVILGAGALVCCGFAVYRFFGEPDDDSQFNRSAEQDAYMREVRERTFRTLPNMPLKGPYFPNGNLSHAPISPSGTNTTYG
ncbi:hypothetical protein CFE70_004129 [Pyrenophora teres f. teres 0-1]|uniref:Uncharacterized protein n=2 Tax=Pyrenophora teres f. teres TaxID=97479 RepID=E3RJK3_PYRTT|nr:hypothetical protein PTT_08332 [Pyrenophora teres f. teres 0-1]KAE8833079.1 hypothetical protein HRS9139_04898 [Pyrenophora teres f. teres]CAA9960754.1 hypothetical protein PTMSG1_04138 [Pyrenophora teres f. maculata]KAE8841152.1 hypothetical protein PTNB85_04551 [Pyrenophora teres f. teres]KAE8848710.1 hypothetical protein HRS9122_02726 [Pyrenophora teres f. teres]